MTTQAVFRALADPTRRDILVMLAREDMTIAEVSEHFDMTRAAVKKHLSVLQEGELISVRIEGRARVNHLEPHALILASEWLDSFRRFWDDRFADLHQAIEAEKSKDNKND
ncbi:MAG: metalloregulator ArsR/SmtB family transcription factor [Hyphomicrobiales bacterium]|nr:metalloregulator ArsR/SmtB family transcription factor [Hyphomicrobiales bacterium]